MQLVGLLAAISLAAVLCLPEAVQAASEYASFESFYRSSLAVMWLLALMEDFSYSIRSEPDNPITPLLFAIFLDRATYRFNDGYLSSKSRFDIYDVSRSVPYDERQAIIQLGLLTRNFVRTK